MTRRMLINAQRSEELRIAIIDNSALEEYQVEVADRGLTVGNIYRGKVANVQPGLNAAFVDYGAERHGFLSIQDVVPEAYHCKVKDGERRPRIEEVLERGRPILVQVEKDPQGLKGAAVTTNVSLAGRYLVLTPYGSTVGVSRKVEDDEARKKLKQRAAKLQLPPGCGVIVRTNASDQTQRELNRDLNALLRVWRKIDKESAQGKGIKLVHSDQNLILRALRDYFESTIQEVLVDEESAHRQTMEHMRAFMPRSKTEVALYTERMPIFSRYGLEQQIDRIYDREVGLPSGGSIVIDRTEALTAIDVNSGRGSGRATQEETALQTNLEAAEEVARQLRLRDIGGLLVVDFIDMRAQKSQRRLERVLKDAMKADKARSTVGRISPNGLLEINRQRIRQELHLRTHETCPTCRGTGRIASAEMVGLNLMRRILARAATGSISGVRIRLHPEVADAFQNGRRAEIVGLEQEFEIRVEVVASSRLHLPDLEIDWMTREVPASAPAEPVNLITMDVAPAQVERTAGSGAQEPAAGGADAPAPRKPRRRRRRGGRKSAARSASTTAEKPPEESAGESSEKPADQPRERSTENAGSSTGSGEEKAARPSRPRRRRPRRRSRRKSPAETPAPTPTPTPNG